MKWDEDEYQLPIRPLTDFDPWGVLKVACVMLFVLFIAAALIHGTK